MMVLVEASIEPVLETDLFGYNKEVVAIQRLKEFEPPEGYYMAFNGGKDSIVLKALADMGDIKYDYHYSVTTIDPPELVYFIRRYYPDVIYERAPRPFLKELEIHGFPSRIGRWCCEVFKESGGRGRSVITGVRWEESNQRRSRRMVEICKKDGSTRFLHPIIDWTSAEIWQFIKRRSLAYCKLYDEGWKRIGCLFCPMAPTWERLRAIERYPKFADAFRRAFQRLYEKRKENGSKSVDKWKNGSEMFDWWIRWNDYTKGKSCGAGTFL